MEQSVYGLNILPVYIVLIPNPWNDLYFNIVPVYTIFIHSFF